MQSRQKCFSTQSQAGQNHTLRIYKVLWAEHGGLIHFCAFWVFCQIWYRCFWPETKMPFFSVSECIWTDVLNQNTCLSSHIVVAFPFIDRGQLWKKLHCPDLKNILYTPSVRRYHNLKLHHFKFMSQKHHLTVVCISARNPNTGQVALISRFNPLEPATNNTGQK